MIFKLYDCDIGLTLRGVNYDFEHVDSVTIDDPERVRLTRGVNRGNKEGVIYVEGSKEAKTITTSNIGIPKELHDLLKEAYEERERMDLYIVSRKDGSSKTAKKAVLTQSPKQLNLDDSPESMNTELAFESYNVDEVHKS